MRMIDRFVPTCPPAIETMSLLLAVGLLVGCGGTKAALEERAKVREEKALDDAEGAIDDVFDSEGDAAAKPGEEEEEAPPPAHPPWLIHSVQIDVVTLEPEEAHTDNWLMLGDHQFELDTEADDFEANPDVPGGWQFYSTRFDYVDPDAVHRVGLRVEPKWYAWFDTKTWGFQRVRFWINSSGHPHPPGDRFVPGEPAPFRRGRLGEYRMQLAQVEPAPERARGYIWTAGPRTLTYIAQREGGGSIPDNCRVEGWISHPESAGEPVAIVAARNGSRWRFDALPFDHHGLWSLVARVTCDGRLIDEFDYTFWVDRPDLELARMHVTLSTSASDGPSMWWLSDRARERLIANFKARVAPPPDPPRTRTCSISDAVTTIVRIIDVEHSPDGNTPVAVPGAVIFRQRLPRVRDDHLVELTPRIEKSQNVGARDQMTTYLTQRLPFIGYRPLEGSEREEPPPNTLTVHADYAQTRRGLDVSERSLLIRAHDADKRLVWSVSARDRDGQNRHTAYTLFDAALQSLERCLADERVDRVISASGGEEEGTAEGGAR